MTVFLSRFLHRNVYVENKFQTSGSLYRLYFNFLGYCVDSKRSMIKRTQITRGRTTQMNQIRATRDNLSYFFAVQMQSKICNK